MKLNENYFYTLRENVKDEDSKSGSLLVRSSMIKKIGNGIYMYMPIGFRVLKNIENIVREEMNNAGATELVMPSLLPEDYYVESGRLDVFGKGIFKLNDRYERNYVLGPTHEELFCLAAKESIKSYKDLPFNLYQIGRKYRDEPRPRYGLIRVREFVMKDAYSFDKDMAGLNVSYKKMYDAYKKIFDRIGIDYKIVKADTGAMGGILSEEFQAVTAIGEDTLVLCDKCNYSSNIEVSECVTKEIVNTEQELEIAQVHTPNAGTIEEVTQFLNLPVDKFVKTLIYKMDNELYAVMVKASREVNETKLSKLLGKKDIELASPEEVTLVTNAKVGFAGPVNIKIPVIMDSEIKNMKNFIVGANVTDYHFTNVNIKDFNIATVGDIKNVLEKDPCPICGYPLNFKKGIEIGNTFKLGTKYTEALDVLYTDSDNQQKPAVMGCYGIGIERIMTSVVEQNNDEFGIIWPMNIAPYKVAIVLIDPKNETQANHANEIYSELSKMGIETLLDNREERPGIKFNDMDLIGIPVRITIGKKITENMVEVKLRKTGEVTDISVTDVIDHVKKTVESQM